MIDIIDLLNKYTKKLSHLKNYILCDTANTKIICKKAMGKVDIEIPWELF